MRALPVRPSGSAVDEIDGVQAELDALADGLRAEGVSAKATARRSFSSDPTLAIFGVAEEQNAGLIVMSIHGRSGLGRWVYGSVAESVLRHGETRVLLIPPHCDLSLPVDRPLRILVPLDGSHLAEEALTAAEQLTQTAGAELILLRVVEFPVYPLYGDGYAYVLFDEDAELADAEQCLSEQMERLRMVGKSASMQVRVG